MKQNQLFRIAIVGALWLCVGVGCQKDPPNPNCWEGQRTKFVKRLQGSRAEYGGSGFSFQEVLVEANGYKLNGASVCYSQRDEIRKLNLKNNFTIENGKARLIDSTRIYPYKVWGTVYELPDSPNFFPIPTLTVWIAKVEEVK